MFKFLKEKSYNVLTESLFDERDASTEHNLTIAQEAWLKSRCDWRQAIKERNEIFVVILQYVELEDEWRHKQCDEVWIIEMTANRAGQSSDGVVEAQQTVALLVLTIGLDKHLQDVAQVRDKLLWTSLFLQCNKLN